MLVLAAAHQGEELRLKLKRDMPPLIYPARHRMCCFAVLLGMLLLPL